MVCGSSQICEHDRRRSQCKECLGSSICLNKRRSRDQSLTLIKGMPLHCSGSEESLTGKLLSPLAESL